MVQAVWDDLRVSPDCGSIAAPKKQNGTRWCRFHGVEVASIDDDKDRQ